MTWRSCKPTLSRGTGSKPALAGFVGWLSCFFCIASAGCFVHRQDVEHHLQAKRFIQKRNQGVAENYVMGCPDVLQVSLAAQAKSAGKFTIGADGRIELGPNVRVRVEGHTPGEAAVEIAAAIGTAPTNVAVEVAEYHSQHVILFGQVIGWQRVVAYQGQETVLDLLHRAGGIARGAAPESIYVVRTHVEDGLRPEIFHVNLPAIVQKNDDRTNIRILPYDQIYVGETRQSHIEKLVPPCIRPFYQMFWRTLPDHGAPGGG